VKNIHGLKSVHIAKNYLDYLREAYLIFLVDKYFGKPREAINSPKKVYVVDTGLATMLPLSAPENTGLLMENLVYVDLLRRRSIYR